MAFISTNPYKAAWQVVGVIALSVALYFGVTAGTRAYAAYNFLTEPLPFTGPDKKPLTRAGFIQLQLEAAAKPPTPAPTPTPVAKP